MKLAVIAIWKPHPCFVSSQDGTYMKWVVGFLLSSSTSRRSTHDSTQKEFVSSILLKEDAREGFFYQVDGVEGLLPQDC